MGKSKERGDVMMTGVKLISLERDRQKRIHGYWAEDDDRHTKFTLTRAATSYAMVVSAPDSAARKLSESVPTDDWPSGWPWNPSDDPIRNLVKAGALIAAEIDRLMRKQNRLKAELPTKKKGGKKG